MKKTGKAGKEGEPVCNVSFCTCYVFFFHDAKSGWNVENGI